MMFPRYPNYKASDVSWLGDIPADWNVIKFRYVFEESPEKISEQVVGDMLSVSGYRGIEVKQYQDEGRRRTDEELFGYRVVRPGQLVVNTMWLNYAGLGVSEHEGHVSPAYRSYWIDPLVDKRFIHHLMRSGTYVQGYTQLLTGIRPNSLQMGRDDLMGFPVLLPAKSEQTQIARFLDYETARVDALIEEQQRLIELLKEKCQAEISHAVTKGLDPTVPMKDSAVEWLGEVPAHWPLPKLGHLARVLNGSTPSRDNMDYWSDGDIPWVASGSLNDYRIDLASEFITKKALKECSVEMIPRGAILVGLVGQGKTRGLAALLNIEATINQNVCAVVPDKKKVLSGYLHLYLHCIYEPLRDFGRGANQAALNCELVSALRIPLPCMEEQSRIVKYIESKLNEFDTLEDYSQRSIGLMQERRSALISAAVTGKIDVRGWQSSARAPSPELVQEAV